MASGVINLGTDNHLTGQIVWSATANGTAANTSTVTITLQVARAYGSSYTTGGTFTGSVTLGGTTKTFSKYAECSTSWVTLYTLTITKAHNNDGTGTCYIAGTINGPTGTTMAGRSVSSSKTVTLDTIPRYASIVSVANFTDEGNPAITYSNPAGNSVDSLQACISLTGSGDDVPYRDIPKTGSDNYTFELTDTERNTLRAATPNSNTLSVQFFVRTVIGSGQEHSAKTATMSIVNANPTVSPVVVDTNSKTIALTGSNAILVALHSTASVTINAAAKKYATISSKKVEHNGVTLTADGTLSSISDSPIKFTVTDSRGNTTTQNATNTIVPYINPTCVIGNSMPTVDGNMTLSVSGKYYNGSFGAESNSLTVQYRYKVTGGTYCDWITIANPTLSGNNYTATAEITGLEYTKVYVFQSRVTDALSAVASAEKSFTAKPVFDWGKEDFKFNVPVYDEYETAIRNGRAAYTGSGESAIDPDTTLEHLCLTHLNTPTSAFYYIHTFFYNTKSVSGNKTQRAYPYNAGSKGSYTRYMVGGVWSAWENDALKSYPVNSIYISYSHTSPAELFGGTWTRIINTETGAGVFLYGCTEAGVIGEFGGEATHTLTVDEIPSHTHDVRHSVNSGTGGSDPYLYSSGGITQAYVTSGRNAIKSVATGGGAAHNNIPPFVKVSIWRRTA